MSVLTESSNLPIGSPPHSSVAEPLPVVLPARKLAIGSLFFSFQPLMLSAAMLPATAYVIRGLGPTAWGQWTAATTLIATTSFLTNLGLRGPFVRSVARNPEQGDAELADQLGIRFGLSLLAAAVALCAALHYHRVVLLCTLAAALGMVLNSLVATMFDLLQGLQRFSTVATLTMISGVILTGISAVVVWRNGGVMGVALAYLAGPVVALGLAVWFIRREYFAIRVFLHPARAVKLLWEARFFAAQQLANTASQNVTAIAVSVLLGLETFGFFSAGAMLADRLTVVADGLGNAAYSAVARASQGGARAILGVVGHFLLLVLAVCLPITVGVSLLAGPVASLLFPHQPETCRQVIRLTVWLLPLAGVENVLGYSLNALHKDAAQARAAFFSGVHLFLAAFLVWKFGLVGACWAMVLRPGVQLVMILPCTVRTFGPLWREYRNPLAAGNGPAEIRPLTAQGAS